MTRIEITRQILARTRNQAVLPLLADALRSTSAEVRAAAIRATIQRADPQSHAQLLRHFATLGQSEREILAQAHRAMPHHAAPTLKAALLGSDATLCDHACRFILLCCDFDSMPALLMAAENAHHRQASLIAATILQLANSLHEQLAQWTSGSERSGSDPTFVRHQVLVALENFISHDTQSVRSEIIEAFLLLAPSDHRALLCILCDAHHGCHAQIVTVLASSERPSLYERLVALLRDTDAPTAALEAIARRTDRPFVEYLLQTVRQPVPLRVLHNMKRLRSVAWLESHREMLLDLDGRAQAVAVGLAAASDIAPAAMFELLMLLVREGLGEGRRAACQALARFDGPPADMLVLAALEDPDAGVQAAAVRQLRPRGLPEALKALVALLDAPSAEVRDAARSSLAEFNFVRYRAMFDLLDENAVKTTGFLVHKVDDSAIEGLIEELMSPSVSARLRGIEMALAMQATQDVCEQLVELAKHENITVRQAALAALGGCTGPKVLDALELAAGDANHSIAETARQSLARYRQRASGNPKEGASKLGELALSKPREPAGLSRRDKPGGPPQKFYAPFFLCVLAVRDLPRVWGRFDHQRPTGGISQMLMVAGMAALAAAVLLIWFRATRRPRRHFLSNSAARLYRELCHAHALSRSNRRLLKRLAAERGVDGPALLFVEPSYFDTSNLPASLQPAASELRQLRTQLFGETHH